MSVHLSKELDHLKRRLLSLSARCQQQLQQAVQALLDCDEELARRVAEHDRELDSCEVEIEEECLKTLALYQPVAADLRLIVAILKINNDLERIGDLAVNVAHKAMALVAVAPPEHSAQLARMGRDTQQMLADSIRCLVEGDAALAREVCRRDAMINAAKRAIRQVVVQRIREAPQQAEAAFTLLSAARNLERIADHATNIAEDVIYMAEGRIVRHQEAGGQRFEI